MNIDSRRYWLFYRPKTESILGKNQDANGSLKGFFGQLQRPSVLSRGNLWQVERVKYFIEDPDLEHIILERLQCERTPVLVEHREAEGDTALRFMCVQMDEEIHLRITGGARNEITQGEELIENCQEEDTKVIGDMGYDAHKLLEKIEENTAFILQLGRLRLSP